MKTIEELEAELETVTRERDLSLSAWESAGMTGRTAQSAMLELTRQLEEARAEAGRLRESVEKSCDNYGLDPHSCLRWELKRAERQRDEARASVKVLQRAADNRGKERDEARAEVERLQQCWQEASDARSTEMACRMIAERERDRLREQVVTVNNNIETFQKETWRYKRERDEARAEVERLTRESATLNAMLDGRMPDTWREDIETLTHQLADAMNESTHFQVMCKREGEEIERLARQVELLTDERDELLVRVANQEAELRATREAYNGAQADVRRFRDWYRNAFGGPSKRETPWDPCACDECESLRRLKGEP